MAVEDDQSAQQRADWYTDGDANVEQGDILLSFRVLTPVASETEGGDYAFAARTQTIVVLTQSCDIPKQGQRTLMAASIFDYQALAATPGNDHLRSTDYRQSLRLIHNSVAQFEEVESAYGFECRGVAGVGPAVVGVQNAPGLEV